MGLAVCGTATVKCSFGSVPSILNVLPSNMCVSKTPLANVTDNKPFVNITGFGMCTANPAQPKPCVPAAASLWMPGAGTVLINNMPALTQDCKLMCAMGGMIEILNAGQQNIVIG